MAINTPVEEILDRFRDNRMTPTAATIDTLEKALVATEEILDILIKTLKEGDKDYSALVVEIESHINP